MDDVAFVSVAFGAAYIEQQDRLKESILAIYPDANIIFFTRGTWPPMAKTFYQSLYGFKPHAINEARRMGFKRIIWLDPAMILCDKVDDLFQYPVIAVKDDNQLHDLISERTLAHYGLTREGIKKHDWRLVGGSLYYFDFNQSSAKIIFNMWLEAEIEGLFGSQQEQASEQINGHRMDETLMAVAMYLVGVDPQPGPDVRYCIEKNPIFIKKHFK